MAKRFMKRSNDIMTQALGIVIFVIHATQPTQEMHCVAIGEFIII